MLIKGRLVIFSGVSHHQTKYGYVAHRGFVREVDIWARIFEEVLVVTRLCHEEILSDEVSYSEQNIRLHILPAPDNTDGLSGKLRLMFYGIIWLWQSLRLLTSTDILMARGPDSIGFLGWLVSRVNHLPRFAKYADQWEEFTDEPLGYRLQKMFYRANNFGGPVMIYGTSDSQHPHLIPFFTSGLSRDEWEQAEKLVGQRLIPPPFRLLFVGRFVYFKGVDVLLDALKILNEQRSDLILDLVGDGPERSAIQERIALHHLENINLHGWVGPDELSLRYAQAHIFIHPSRKEGFGKVLLEAMSYDLPIVGADVGISRELVAKNRCGFLFQNEDASHLASQINLMLSNSSRQEFGNNGRIVSQELVLENLEQRYRDFVHKVLYLS